MDLAIAVAVAVYEGFDTNTTAPVVSTEAIVSTTGIHARRLNARQ
jgi:hypothetical protein